jgi:hypothetical protein
VRYLAIPGVVYEERFPTTKKFRPMYFLGHCTLLLMNLWVQYILLTDNILPIFQNPLLKQELYDVSALKRDYDLENGINHSESHIYQFVDESSSILITGVMSILEWLGINAPTINFYLEIQLYAMGFFVLHLHLWFESLPNALAEMTFYADR